MDMQKYKPLYLSEAEEHLDALERELVQIERDPGAKSRIDEVFRHLHSLKSMSASMGYTPISDLAHRLEDLVSPHRDSDAPVAPGLIDLLLRGLDALRERVLQSVNSDVVASVSEDLLESIAMLARISGPGAAGDAGPSASPPVATPADPKSPPAPTQGRDLLVTVTVDAANNMPAIRAFVARRRLGEIGQVLWSAPEVAELKAGHLPERTLRLSLRTERTTEQVRALLEGLAEIASIEVISLPAAQTEAASPGPVEIGQPAPIRAGATDAPPAEAGSASIRVRTELLDFFVDSVGELITLRSYFEDVASRIDDPALRDGVRRMKSQVRKLQDRVMEVRMVPASLLTDRLPRICRDVARTRDKRVTFSVEGEGVRLDRALVEALQTPFLHLLRNAIEHGIESPSTRRAAGKPEEGQLHLSVLRQQDRVIMRLADDGRGIDLEAVGRRAQGAGLIPTGSALSEVDLIELIFRPGFSTSDGVNELSGRGVGLDSVRETIESLGGRVSAEAQADQGTTFTIDLPLTLATLQVLLVQANDVLLALPAARVLRASAINPGLLVDGDGEPAITLAGQTIPIQPLDRLLQAEGQASRERVVDSEMVVVGSGDRPVVALGVDRVTGHQEVVLKVLGHLLRNIGPYNGSTILGDGRPVLILDVDALIARAAQLTGAP